MAQKRILRYLQRTAYIGNVKKMEKKNGTYINITLCGLPEFQTKNTKIMDIVIVILLGAVQSSVGIELALGSGHGF